MGPLLSLQHTTLHPLGCTRAYSSTMRGLHACIDALLARWANICSPSRQPPRHEPADPSAVFPNSLQAGYHVLLWAV